MALEGQIESGPRLFPAPANVASAKRAVSGRQRRAGPGGGRDPAAGGRPPGQPAVPTAAGSWPSLRFQGLGVRPFYIMQSARLRVGSSADLQLRGPAGGNFISWTLANHGKPGVADGQLFVAGQVCAPRCGSAVRRGRILPRRPCVLQRAKPVPASPSSRGRARNTAPAVPRLLCSCLWLSKRDSWCPWQCRTGKSCEVVCKGCGSSEAKKMLIPLLIFFTQALLAPLARVSQVALCIWICLRMPETFKKNGVHEGISSTSNQAPV